MAKLGFVTCVQLGLSCMKAIYEAGGRLDLAITLHDDKAVNKSGRVHIDEFCAEHDVPVHKCNHVNDADVVELIKAKELDWLFIIGWSQIASPEVLNAPKLGVLGAHPTLLPEGRGRAAIPWAIIKRLDKTGVTLFKLDQGVDTGEILDQVELPLGPDTTATDLYHAVDDAHISLIKKVVPQLLSNSVMLRVQDDSLATIWPGRKPEDGEIDLNGSVHDAECLVRAVTHPYPGAFVYRDGKKLVVWKAEVVDAPSDDCIEFEDGYLKLLDFEFIDA
jgi:methionyl-tRNA formyltransferase